MGFLGEMLCMVAFWISACYRGRRPEGSPYADIGAEETQPRPFSPLVFLPPALCDMTATSVQYIGLTLTYASSFQMLRGAVIIFTGILSVIFLRRRLEWFRWSGMILVIGGLVTVGLTDILYTPNGKNSTEIQPIPEYNTTYQPEFNYGKVEDG